MKLKFMIYFSTMGNTSAKEIDISPIYVLTHENYIHGHWLVPIVDISKVQDVVFEGGGREYSDKTGLGA
jgi:hypothetical protein